MQSPAAQRPAAEIRSAQSVESAALTQHRVEQFLYREGMLLDAWKLDEWLALFTEDARYVVPSTDYPQGDPPEYPALIDDDLTRLKGRVSRLTSRHAYREYPYSRTRHFVSNVLTTEAQGDEMSVTASFLVCRMKNREVAQYIGRYLYVLKRGGDEFRIRLKRCELDLEGLWEQGTVSILL